MSECKKLFPGNWLLGSPWAPSYKLSILSSRSSWPVRIVDHGVLVSYLVGPRCFSWAAWALLWLFSVLLPFGNESQLSYLMVDEQKWVEMHLIHLLSLWQVCGLSFGNLFRSWLTTVIQVNRGKGVSSATLNFSKTGGTLVNFSLLKLLRTCYNSPSVMVHMLALTQWAFSPVACLLVRPSPQVCCFAPTKTIVVGR